MCILYFHFPCPPPLLCLHTIRSLWIEDPTWSWLYPPSSSSQRYWRYDRIVSYSLSLTPPHDPFVPLVLSVVYVYLHACVYVKRAGLCNRCMPIFHSLHLNLYMSFNLYLWPCHSSPSYDYPQSSTSARRIPCWRGLWVTKAWRTCSSARRSKSTHVFSLSVSYSSFVCTVYYVTFYGTFLCSSSPPHFTFRRDWWPK